MLTEQELITDDFSGGITDYILDALPNQSQTLNNFLINPNKKLVQAPGSVIFDSAMYLIPSGHNRISALFNSTALNTLLINSANHVYYPSGTFQELLGPTSNTAFPSATTANFSVYSEYAETVYATNDSLDFPIKMYIDGSSVKQLRTAGLPPLPSSPTCVGTAGANNYIYGFCKYYTYTVGTVVFEDFGPVTYVEVPNITDPGVNPVAIAAIPVLANGLTGNWDTSVTGVSTKVFRTANNGTVLYEVGTVANGTVVFNDNTPDATVINGNLLYTNGGVLDNDPPPQCKFITIVNGVAYYGYVKEGTEILKNRVRQSIQGDPDSVPLGSYIDFLDEVVGLSSFNDNPIVFTKGHVYRLNGYINELGQGAVSFEDITKTIGCKGNNSIVQTRFGVFWAGDDGFYWTDGFQFTKVSDSINESYKVLVSSATKSSRIYGTFDKVDNRVTWTVQSNASNNDNDAFYTIDLRWGVRSASTFTTRTNGSDFAPTAICYYNGDLIRADRRGYLFKHNSQYASDPRVDILVAATSWEQSAIIVTYKSTSVNFSLPFVRKWVPKILVTFENLTNLSMVIESTNDDTGTVKDLYPIRYWNNIIWGAPDPVWGDDTIFWNYYNLIEEMRRFPAGGLRCSYKQITITNAETIIYNSDSVSTANVANIPRTATLTNLSLNWPVDIVDYYISYEIDDYTENYLILSINSPTQITYVDPLGHAPAGVQKWVIRGIPKNQIVNMLSTVVYFSPLTDQSYKTYRREQDPSGGNT